MMNCNKGHGLFGSSHISGSTLQGYQVNGVDATIPLILTSSGLNTHMMCLEPSEIIPDPLKFICWCLHECTAQWLRFILVCTQYTMNMHETYQTAGHTLMINMSTVLLQVTGSIHLYLISSKVMQGHVRGLASLIPVFCHNIYLFNYCLLFLIIVWQRAVFVVFLHNTITKLCIAGLNVHSMCSQHTCILSFIQLANTFTQSISGYTYKAGSMQSAGKHHLAVLKVLGKTYYRQTPSIHGVCNQCETNSR